MKDAMTVVIGNSFTSIYAGIVIFSNIGTMAYEAGQEISEVATQGSGLAFIVYPEAVSIC